MQIVFLGLGVIIGFILCWLFLRSKYETAIGKLEERNSLLTKNYDDGLRQLEEERKLSRTAENACQQIMRICKAI
jgi:hypothetical protein